MCGVAARDFFRVRRAVWLNGREGGEKDGERVREILGWRERDAWRRGMAGAQSGAVRARESRAGEIAQARNLV